MLDARITFAGYTTVLGERSRMDNDYSYYEETKLPLGTIQSALDQKGLLV